MSVQTISVQSRKVGTCPHGNPAGACPLCNGMGGGGSKISFDRNTRRRPGEMTWNECYAMGLILKRQREAKIQDQKQLAAQIANAQKQNNIISAIASKLTAINQSIKANLSKLTDTFKQNIDNISKNIQNLTNTLKSTVLDIADKIKNVLNDVKQKLIDISDKLAAIFGEIKNSVEKQLSDLLKNQLKKVIDFLSFVTVSIEEEEQEAENDSDQRRILNYKKIYDKKLLKYNVNIKDNKRHKHKNQEENKRDQEQEE